MKNLQELYDEVRSLDTRDPACMQKVLEYFEDREEESNNFIQLLVERLEHATISWKRPWYQMSTIVSVPMREDETQETKYLKGRLTKDECDRVEKNWRKFRKRFNVPDHLEYFARWKNREFAKNRHSLEHARRFLAAYLARGLQRTIHHVYRHVVNYYSYPVKGSHYTADEKKIMDICFHHSPKNAPSILTVVLSREGRAIYNKLYETINGKPERKRIKWNLSLATKFIKLLMESTGESLIGLKNKSIGISIWRQLESDFETQGEYLRHFWYTTLHCQMFCKCDITLRRIRRKVFKILRRSPYKIWTDIKWKDVVAQLPDGLTYQFIYWVTVRVFRLDKYHTKLPMDKLVEIGLEKANNKIRGNKRLKTLRLNEEGCLEVIRYNSKF